MSGGPVMMASLMRGHVTDEWESSHDGEVMSLMIGSTVIMASLMRGLVTYEREVHS